MKKLFKGIDRDLVFGIGLIVAIFAIISLILWQLLVIAGSFTMIKLIAINVLLMAGLFVAIILDARS